MYGYAGKILRVDLSLGRTWVQPTSDYAEFIGGRGFAVKVHWDEVPPHVGALDPENRLTFMTGPLAGFPGFGGSRWLVCAKSPATEPEQFCYSNLGGIWGAALKSAGFDGIVVQGKAERPAYLLVRDGTAEIRDAGDLWGKGAIAARETLKARLDGVHVVACGPAGENMVVSASLTADGDSTGTGGMGAVMGSKNLKAVAVSRGRMKPVAAYPDMMRRLIDYRRWLIGHRDMLRYYLQYQQVAEGKWKKSYCWGCPGPCVRIGWIADDGRDGKFFCQSALVYQTRAQMFYGTENPDVPFMVTKLCDDLGLDTRAVHIAMSWLARCYKTGLLSPEDTGIPLDKVGSLEFAEAVLHKMAYREGIGDLLAGGIQHAAAAVGGKAISNLDELHMKAQQDEVYGPRIYMVNGILYAVEPRMPIQHLHETSVQVEQLLHTMYGLPGAFVNGKTLQRVGAKFFGSEEAVNYFSPEGKALAARIIQDRQYAKESLVVCDLVWCVMTSPNTMDHVADPELAARFFMAATGIEQDDAELRRTGEKIFNLQRAIVMREGHVDSLPEFLYRLPVKAQVINPEVLVPGPDGKPASRKGAVLDRAEFDGVMREYYGLRGWNPATGLQTRAKLQELGLSLVAEDLAGRGLLA